MHMNIQSSSKNMNNFNMYLELLNVKFSIIDPSETWGNDSPIYMYTAKGYNTKHQSRSNKRGVDVALLIKDSIQYTPRTDLSVFNDNIESVFIVIDKDDMYIYDEPVIVGVVQVQVINKPTRVKSGSATLFNNIYTNKMSDNAYQGIMFTDITDYFPIFHINMNCKLSETATVITKRSINDKTIESFGNELATMSWDKVLGDNNVETAFSTLYGMFKCIYDKAFPLKMIKLNNYSNRKQWLSVGIKKSIKFKLYIKYMRLPPTAKSSYIKSTEIIYT